MSPDGRSSLARGVLRPWDSLQVIPLVLLAQVGQLLAPVCRVRRDLAELRNNRGKTTSRLPCSRSIRASGRLPVCWSEC